MNIITPPRIDSLESRTIRVIDHSVGSDGAPWTFQAYPFDSILSLKQQIAIHYGTRAYFPNAVFVAVRIAEGYRPLEFRWPFATTLADPVTLDGKVSSELMEGDVRKPVFPTILAGVTYESMGSPTEVHIWSIASVVADLELTPALVAGFVQLYFPAMESVAAVEAFLGTQALSAGEKESLEAIRLFQEGRLTRLGKLESLLGMTAPVPKLQELRALRILLPPAELQDTLDILFHTMTPTRHLPILRYFGANQRTPPLLKLAMTPAGIPLLADAKLLRALLGDAPAAEQGAMILCKAPIFHPKAPFGAAWILRIYENGQGELVLGAPRRDAPLTTEVVQEAYLQLPHLLSSTPWKDADISLGSLEEFTGTYKCTLQQDIRKPTKSELRKRVDPFRPLFREEAPMTGEAALGLRWKAVSNFTDDRDPIVAYITNLFLKESLQSVDRIPVGTYVAAITREFGLGPTEAGAALTHWINRHSEYVLVDMDEKAVAKYNVGAAVSLYNHHPDYLFSLAGVNSYTDLRRILSMLEIWVSHTAQELTTAAAVAAAAAVDEDVESSIPAAPAAPVAEPVEPAAEVDLAQMNDWYQAMEMYGAMDETGNASIVQNTQPQPQQPQSQQQQQEQQPQPQQQQQQHVPLVEEKDLRYPEPIGPDEPPLPPMDSYLIQRLQAHDSELFSYKTDQAKLYSRKCQNSSNKQPNVMSPEAYRRVRSMYGDNVHWVEAPLTKYEVAALHFTSAAVRERQKDARTLKKSMADIFEYEKHMLRLGLPLQNDTSIVSIWPEAPAGAKEEIEALIAQQKSKPLWLVLRAGANRTNYYICAEFWCIRDDLPLIDAEFKGTQSRRGVPKPPNTCPFCGGKEIADKSARAVPKAGETVLRRLTTNKLESGTVALYVGWTKDAPFHPKGYNVPCCFTDPDSLFPHPESQPFPAPLVELPAAQQGGPKTPEEKEVATLIEPTRNLMDPFQDVKIKLDVAEVRGLPAESYRFLDKEKTKAELRAKAIVRAYILSASSFPLELGKVGIVSEAMDAFLGQNAKEYLESPKHGKIYTHPKVQGKAFFRLGLGTKVRNMGAMMLQLIAYARAVVSHIVPPYQAAALTPEQMYVDLFETQEVLTFQAFQQANYGTLVAEFADPDQKPTPGELQTWCGRMGIPLPAQRAYAERLWGAWRRFKAYVADPTQRKELRLWEHLFTAPGLFTATGVIIATITTDENEHVVLRCPSLGIAARQQSVRPPLLLVYEDRRTRVLEPLILYDGPDRLLGVLDPDSIAFGSLSPTLRTPLTAFYSEYFDPKTGCGRPQPVLYPWLEEDSPKIQTGIPRLGALLAVLRKMDATEARYLLRDRSQRLVGVVVSFGDIPLFVPALDDGTIEIGLGSQYDSEALPSAPLGPLLHFLVGPSHSEITGLAKWFVGLLPVELRSQLRREKTMLVALETKAGPLIPIEPLKPDAVVAHPMMSQSGPFRGSVQIDELPWTALTVQKDDAVFLQNPEEQLEESYQHVRVTLSEWLQTSAGKPYKRAIESLRAARARTQLPLYELRKRLDLLLQPILAKWIHVGPKGTTWELSTLRRNCLKVPKGACEGACVWSEAEDSCLIHAAATERFVDPLFVIGARIVDELLRTNEPALQVLQQSVARLRPPVGIVREKDALLLSFEGRGDAATYKALGLEGRLPTRYTQGLVIPEEVGAEDVGCEASAAGIPLTWEGVTHMVWPAEAVGQSLRDIAWAAMVGQPPGRDEMAFYRRVADEKGWTILFTRDTCHGYQLAGRIGPKAAGAAGAAADQERTFVILTPDRVPLGSAKTKQPRFLESELPSVILAWLDESPKEEKRAIEAVLEVQEDGEEDELPFAALERAERAVRAAPPVADGPKREKKPCPEGKERSPISGACVKKCEPGEIRSETGHCKKVRAIRVAVPAKPVAVAEPRQPTPPLQPEPGFGFRVEELTPPGPQCPPEKEVSIKSGQCVIPCKPEQFRNPATGHCNKEFDVSKYDIKRCEKSKGLSEKFPFKKEELLEALREQGVKVRKNWPMAEVCSHVSNTTLQILLKRRERTRKNRNSPVRPGAAVAVAAIAEPAVAEPAVAGQPVEESELPVAKPPEVAEVAEVAEPPLEAPEVAVAGQPGQPEAAATPEPNMSGIDPTLCGKGMSKKFPFRREELLDSLREEKVYLARSATLEKICPRVTTETLRRILKARQKTRKNVRSE